MTVLCPLWALKSVLLVDRSQGTQIQSLHVPVLADDAPLRQELTHLDAGTFKRRGLLAVKADQYLCAIGLIGNLTRGRAFRDDQSL